MWVSTDNVNLNGSVDVVAHTVPYRLNCSWGAGYWQDEVYFYGQFWHQGGSLIADNAGVPAYITGHFPVSGTWYVLGTLPCDSNISARAEAVSAYYSPPPLYGSYVTFKTQALQAGSIDPYATAVTITTATIACDTFYPNTKESTATTWLEYKRVVDSVWTVAGTSHVVTDTGYGTFSISRDITGLIGGTQYQVRLRTSRTTVNDTDYTSNAVTFTTLPPAPSTATNNASSITYNSAVLNSTTQPNSFNVDVYYQWGKSDEVIPDSVYPHDQYAGSLSGTGSQSCPFSISGLYSLSIYHFRVKLVWSGGTIYGSDVAFATDSPPAHPDVTTGGVTSVTHNSVIMNGVLNPNSLSTIWRFQIGPTTAYELGYTADQGPSSANYAFAISAGLNGLNPNTLYHYRACAIAGGVNYYGSDQTFTTSLAPGAAAILEDQVNIFEFNERKYGVQSDIYFGICSPSQTSSDRLFSGAAPFAAGDVKISKDGGAEASTTNLPTRVGTSSIFKLTLTAAEMQASTIAVQLVDQDATPAYRDCILLIRTKQEIGQLVVDATGMGGNNDAVAFTKVGTGRALAATGDLQVSTSIVAGSNFQVGGNLTVAGAMTITGAFSAASISGILSSMVLRTGTAQGGGASAVQLDSGANATDGYYVGCVAAIVAGTGAGQSRVITGYTGSTKQCTVDTAWSVNPANDSVFVLLPTDRVWSQSRGELSALPTDGADYGQKLQFLFQRFAFKITQTAVLQTWFKADGSTSLTTRSVSDSAGTQTVGKLT